MIFELDPDKETPFEQFARNHVVTALRLWAAVVTKKYPSDAVAEEKYYQANRQWRACTDLANQIERKTLPSE